MYDAEPGAERGNAEMSWRRAAETVLADCHQTARAVAGRPILNVIRVNPSESEHRRAGKADRQIRPTSGCCGWQPTMKITKRTQNRILEVSKAQLFVEI